MRFSQMKNKLMNSGNLIEPMSKTANVLIGLHGMGSSLLIDLEKIITSNSLEVEDDEDEDSFIIEFDEEQDSIMTINNQETIDTLIIQAEPISISNADNQILTQLEHQNIVQETNVDKIQQPKDQEVSFKIN
ncbi:hypothetical protein BpHYR1_034021 [Brachionus plicatilis]|uniref:Uncharacterized protein n=1 Tax=Brachionus plicatilis TaxID=10195 RepID=A0A3M7PIN7_BRAPC|nr:hypothetical protein BpHYR1_034021 [Brachionus plicatilis]